MLVVLVLVLAACGGHSGPSSGTVERRTFTAAHDEWVPGIDVAGTCQMIGKVMECSPGVHIPGHMEHHGDAWSVYLNDGHRKGWVDVDRATYERCRMHEFCKTKP